MDVYLNGEWLDEANASVPIDDRGFLHADAVYETARLHRGGYFRLVPYAVTRRAITSFNADEAQPAMFYLHPWEVDPDQPRLRASLRSGLRHYNNLARTEPRLRRLLADFRWGAIEDAMRPAPPWTPDARIPAPVGAPLG